MSDYQFVTIWQFQAPLERVWQEINAMSRWPAWWPYVANVDLLQRGDANELGSIRRITWKTALPYTLTFDSELTHETYLQRMEGRAFGELEGKGIWTFSEENGITTVRYDWQVSTTKVWMKLLAPIARPIFEWNHDKLMKAGYKGLNKRLTEVPASRIG